MSIKKPSAVESIYVTTTDITPIKKPSTVNSAYVTTANTTDITTVTKPSAVNAPQVITDTNPVIKPSTVDSPYVTTDTTPTRLAAAPAAGGGISTVAATVSPTVSANANTDTAASSTGSNVSYYASGIEGIAGLANQGRVFEGANVYVTLEQPQYVTYNQIFEIGNSISVTGNITTSDGYFIGNGSQLTGVVATSSYGNANVVANLAALGSNPVSTTGNVTGGYFIGNGSQLTGLAATYGNSNVATFLAAYGSNTVVTTGNVTAGNVLTSAEVIASGVIQTGTGFSTGGYLSVNGSTNLHDTNIIGTLSVNTIRSDDSTIVLIQDGVEVDGDAVVNGNVTGAYILGNGSQLTGISTANTGNVTFSGETVIGTGTSNTQSGLYLAPDPVSLANDLYLRVRGNILDEPTHIHFDTGNNQYYNLIIGDDNKYIQLANTGNIVINTNNYAGNTAQWTFDTDGSLTLPGANVDYTIATQGGYITVGNLLIGQGGSLFNSNNDSWALYGNLSDPGTSISIPSDAAAGNGTPLVLENQISNVEIRSGFGTWTFGNTSNLTLPLGGIVSEGASPSGLGNTIALTPSGGSDADQQLLIYPTGNVVVDGNHLHLTTGNLLNTELYLGNDDFYVKLANTGDIIVNTAGNTAQWTFGTDGLLTFPTGNLVITPDDPAGNIASIVSTDHPLGILSTGANGAVSSLWVEDYANVGTSNIAAVYANPTPGSKIVRIAVGQNGSPGPNLWDFNANGTLTLPNGAVIKDTAGDAVAFGQNAGGTSQGTSAVAIGSLAGNANQGVQAVALGTRAGQTTQGNNATAIGADAGYSGQSANATAVGGGSAQVSQGDAAVAVGHLAGQTSQGISAVAIGKLAGNTNQANNSIILNATGVALDQTTANTFTVAPVRNDVANTAQVMFYNTTSKEITYGNVISVAGNITAGNIIANNLGNIASINLNGNANTVLYGNGVFAEVAGGGSYGNANVVANLAALGSNPVSTTGNITGGNILFGSGIVSGTGNITGGNLDLSYMGGAAKGNLTGGNISVTGNITGGNISTAGLLSTGGNVTGGNILTAGAVSASSTITGANLSTGGTVSATGNVAGGNIVTGGLISATGNITSAGNILNQGFVSSTGNAIHGNILTGGLVSATGNITGGNLSVVGTINGSNINLGFNLSATGTVTGSNFNTTGLISAGGNVTVGNLLTTGVISATSTITSAANVTGGNILTAGQVSATGNIVTAGNFVGNGAALTNVTVSVAGNIVGTQSNVTLVAGAYNWTFDNTGNLTLPGNTFAVNYANNTPVNAVTRFESAWTVPVGNSTQNFTVGANETYYLWVDCNIPNGILVWNATATVTNTNVPVVGAQYAWVYNGGGSPVDFTSIPDQFIGTSNTIVRSNVAPSSTTNRFDFGINNTSGGNITVRYGWIAIS